MGIREKLNNNPALTTGATAAFVIIMILVLVWQFTRGNPMGGDAPEWEYYTTKLEGPVTMEDVFVDEYAKAVPFDHQGSEAVKAVVFECDGQRFVGYLLKYTENGKQTWIRAQAEREQAEQAAEGQGGQAPPPSGMMDPDMFSLIKAPDGTGNWVPMGTGREGGRIRAVECPGGSGFPEIVFPDGP